MPKRIFYNSSLPRAGSTLIQNILAQNPDMHCTPTSGIFELFMQTRTYYSNGIEFKAQDTALMDNGIRGYFKGAIHGFYDNITEKPYVMEKSRGWGMEYNFIKEYDPNPKIICMLRDIRAIYASLEKKYRANPLVETNIANWGNLTGTTTDKRVITWSANPPIGPSMDRLYQVLVDGTHQHILFIKFEDLCIDPEKQLRAIYDYLEIPYFQHNFNNVDQLTHEDDKWYGIFGDHIIRGKVQPVKDDYREVLGPNACKIIEDNYQWFFNDLGYKI